MSDSEERRRDDPDARWNKPRRPRGRKDTRRWCKGKPGREHTLEVVIPENAYRKTCEWSTGFMEGEPRLLCGHVERCSACGKVTRQLWWAKQEEAAGFCPDYTDPPAVSSARR